MRAHAHVEQHIQRLKDSGLCRFPFTSFEANCNWMMAVAISADLVRWFQRLCFDGNWVNARQKAMRWGIFHAPGRLISGHVNASCASSTVGRAPMRCSTPTGASNSSPDRFQRPARRHQLDDTRPNTPARSLAILRIDRHAGIAISPEPQSMPPNLTLSDSLSQAESPVSRERYWG
jgi:hypothetical protein